MLIPHDIIKEMFWSLMGPSLVPVLKERRRGVATQLKARAMIPTRLHQLTLGLLDLYLAELVGNMLGRCVDTGIV